MCESCDSSLRMRQTHIQKEKCASEMHRMHRTSLHSYGHKCISIERLVRWPRRMRSRFYLVEYWKSKNKVGRDGCAGSCTHTRVFFHDHPLDSPPSIINTIAVAINRWKRKRERTRKREKERGLGSPFDLARRHAHCGYHTLALYTRWTRRYYLYTCVRACEDREENILCAPVINSFTPTAIFLSIHP